MLDGVFFARSSTAAALLCAAALLAGCDAAMQSVARGMSEGESRAESARLEAQGAPQFADPKLQAIVRDFEAEYARYGRDGDKLMAEAAGPCAIEPQKAYTLLTGSVAGESADQMREVFAKQGMAVTEIVDFESLRLLTVSGSCGPEGVEGPAEIVGSYRTITRLESQALNQVTVTDTVSRIRGSWQDGARRGPFRIAMVIRTATFEPTEGGELKEQVHDWDYLNEMRDAPSAIWTYATFGPGYEADPVVSFSRNPEAGLFSTTVTEQRGGGRGYQRSYQGSELRSEGTLKDGVMHGWLVSHPYTYQGTRIEGSRTCFQNGERVLATSCPEN